MKPLLTIGSVLMLLIAQPRPMVLLGQVNPYATQPDPNFDPRLRRAKREQAVVRVGPVARALVETWGDEAVNALFACTPAVGRKLAEFHAAGELAKLPRPRDLLRVIGQRNHGDDVARWAMQNASELTEPDYFDAYLRHPLEYALGLKQLQDGVAEAHARRRPVPAAQAPAPGQQAVEFSTPAQPQLSQQDDLRPLLVVLGLGGVIVLAIWWKNRQQ